MFATLFKDLYMNMFSNKKKTYPVIDEEELEKALQNYIMEVMGYSVTSEYRRCIARGEPQAFPYYGAVKRWLVNLIDSFDNNKSRGLIEAITEYSQSFYDNIAKYPYVDKLISGIKKLYSSDDKNPNVVIRHKDELYKIFILDDKHSDGMPAMVINNIEKLNRILGKYIDAVMHTDNNYRKVLEEYSDDDEISKLLMWTLMNVSNMDALDLERYFKKYTSFLNDTTFDYYRNTPKKMGNILYDDLYLLLRKSTCAYETPYYLAFMLKNKRVELPNVRMGIETRGDEKIAHILSIQSTQVNPNPEMDPLINGMISKSLPKSPNFREFNPSHLLSLTITLGMLSSMGITKINAYEYLPMRYQRFVNEGRKDEDELYQYQHRLTNKFINNFLRLLEFTDDIEIVSYPENGEIFQIRLKDNIKFENTLLDEAFMVGYNQKNNIDEYNDYDSHVR